ncbi:MAG: hypothetical protein UU84_C0038G0001 [Candidatus Yanofskybacteria bacterium GW2011_GWC2_41_9]|uniref:Uncharacterized protein n=1 Tax=Candidatus Yanofskybacteria bacterium GW2011_GWC2_41_9 TaxID=1619029 RepID=A0A0G1AKI9_9BACT|nr:MAG: hypothetical protein UU84_C0038G0001 [Candidatus Yanofskybacteria bacterium GW2011_GWC2_41_9]OGN20790.1 MAG: hypothetical protein A3B00_00445 [Candidatus Yanofskybacteria bacterium RIFCSPLOWO2_01_FULL_41_33]
MKPPEPTRLVVFDIITSSLSKTGALKAKVHAEELRRESPQRGQARPPLERPKRAEEGRGCFGT